MQTRKVVRGPRLVSALTPSIIQAWIEAAKKFIPAKDKLNAAKRFDPLMATLAGADRTHTRDVTWAGMQEAWLALDPDGTQYRGRLANTLNDLACDADGARYVARSLVGHLIYSRQVGRTRRPIGARAQAYEGGAREA